MGQDNPTCRRPNSLPDDELELKVMVSPQAKQQPDTGFSKPHSYPGDHSQTLDNANGSSNNFYPNRLRFSGATGTQSEVQIVEKLFSKNLLILAKYYAKQYTNTFT